MNEDIVAKIEIWIEELNGLIPEPLPSKKGPVYGVGELVQQLHDVMSEYSRCACCLPHEVMLFMASHRSVEEAHRHVTFDVLFRMAFSGGSKWHESQVAVVPK